MNASLDRRGTFSIIFAIAIGGAAGWLVGQSLPWLAAGALVGMGTAAMISVVGVRPLVAVPVGVGAGVGAYVGGTVVGLICEPQACPVFEASAAVTTGIGALVGIGLVVALVTRSFEEYNEAMERGAPPPVSSCGNGAEESD